MKRTFAERFWAKVDKTGECWEWTGYLDRNGYGQISRAGPSGKRMHYAHRVSWDLAYGPVEAGLSVLHRCDNPKCVRPDHLFLGTQADNMADRQSKGRQTLGARNGNARITAADVLEIRRSSSKRVELAAVYGVTPQAISKIVKRERWKHVE